VTNAGPVISLKFEISNHAFFLGLIIFLATGNSLQENVLYHFDRVFSHASQPEKRTVLKIAMIIFRPSRRLKFVNTPKWYSSNDRRFRIIVRIILSDPEY
jgi:hypothetical protein